MSQPPIHIQFSVEQAEALFQRVIQSAPSPAQAIAGLNALELVLGCHIDSGDRQSKSYAAIRDCLGQKLDQQRNRLLQQQAEELAVALNCEEYDTVTRIHAGLSREGFYRMVELFCIITGETTVAPVADKVGHWCREAEQQARQASPYPDAFDWQRANVDLNKYMAMQDLQLALASMRSIRLHPLP